MTTLTKDNETCLLKQKAEEMNEILLDSNGIIKLLPASFYLENFSTKDLQVWGHFSARYAIPTVELIEFLKEKIGNRSAIEIGSGNGDIGYHLGIKQTDSYMQQKNKQAIAYYLLSQQPRTNPRKDFVEEIDALAAITKYKPDIVIGAWVTQLYNPIKNTGNMFGVDDQKIIENADYIHVGNKIVHGHKDILVFPHETTHEQWIVSRASQPSQNVIWHWKKSAP